tara:strand:+ start:20 stop:730 length:711 start_codon:yes stop_codon:yes gene_type:complete
MDTAIGYVRVSSEQQAEEGLSLAWQKEKIEAYCSFSNLRLIKVIVEEDAISGGVPLNKRPGGSILLNEIKSSKPNHIVAYSLSRLFRDAVDGLYHSREWDKQDIALCLLDVGGQAINTRSAMGRMFLSMMLSFSELEKNLTGERVKETHRYKKNRMEVYGSTPYGFDRDDMSLLKNEAELQVVKRIYKLRDNGLSYGKIAEYLNDEGIVGKKGGKFYPITVSKIVKNDIYEADIRC